MEFFKISKDIPFMRHALAFNLISLLTFLLAVFFLFSRGLNLSVEFTGGTLMEVSYPHPVDINQARIKIEALGLKDVQVQNFGTSRDILIRLPASKGGSAARQNEQVIEALRQADAAAELRRTEFVGPQVGDELAIDGLKALAFVVLGIMLYLAIRFEWKFSIAAIVAISRLNAGTNSLGNNLELLVIAATVIGGTALAGGSGTIIGSVLGALIMQCIDSGMLLLDVSIGTRYIIIGQVLIAAVVFDVAYRKWTGDTL